MTQNNNPIRFHLIPNAHLDPVWLWDWREGATEAVSTARTLLDLMDEYPDLTFVRGELIHYQTIEHNDPSAFERIRQRIAEGRWDVVGGTVLQSDMNMPSTATITRSLLYGQRYFMDRFGLRARVGWSADCFGHSAGLPDVLATGGIESYIYTRPGGVPPQNTFWWQGASGVRLLVHHPATGWYGTERDEIQRRLDTHLALAQSPNNPIRNVLCFVGLGNHGGHPTRRMLADIRAWADAHPEVRVEFSTLTRYFDALRAELSTLPVEAAPVFRGELNFAPRGVYAQAARFKYLFRKAEASVVRAEKIASAVAAATQTDPFDLHEAWDAILFNTFHDVLPGTIVERTMGEQSEWLSGAPHAARKAEQRAIHALAARVDTSVAAPEPDMPAGVPFLVFNPHPWRYQGLVELEACLDFRPIWKYVERSGELPVVVSAAGQPVALQKIEMDSLYAPDLNIRTRVVCPLDLPPFGWKVVEFAYREDAPTVPVDAPTGSSFNEIHNEHWQVEAQVGASGIRVAHDGVAVFQEPGLSAITVEDPFGSWGDLYDRYPEAASLTQVRDVWSVIRVEVGESGPLRSSLHVRMAAGNSRMDLLFLLGKGSASVEVSARVYWDERHAHLKLVLPGGFTSALYDVLGGEFLRESIGEVPGGRWVRLNGQGDPFGFASNALYGFNLTPEGALHASIVRASYYASDARAEKDDHPWRPVLDSGELCFRFLLTRQVDRLEQLATELEQPPLAATVTPSTGDWARSGSLLNLSSPTVRLLALKRSESGRDWILHLQAAEALTEPCRLTWLGQTIPLPALTPHAVHTLCLSQAQDGKWDARLVDLTESTR
jgi:alpha-mannosidase